MKSARMLSPLLLVWLLLVWLMLWGTVNAQTVLFGVLVGVLVLVLYPLPRVRSRFFARPLRLLVLGGYLAGDLLLSAIRLSLDLFRYGRDVKAAIVAVPLLSDMDQVIASAANMLTLAPGKFVLQIDRYGAEFYVYALGVRTVQEAARVRDDVIDLQVRVIGAFGTSDEIRTLPERAARARRDRPLQEGHGS